MGSGIHEFLKQEGILEQVESAAIAEVTAWQSENAALQSDSAPATDEEFAARIEALYSRLAYVDSGGRKYTRDEMNRR
jgi:hypothetical protein